MIDTNVLYRITEILPEIGFSKNKKLNTLNSYDAILILELSVYELFTRFRLDIGRINKVLRFISTNKRKYKVAPHDD